MDRIEKLIAADLILPIHDLFFNDTTNEEIKKFDQFIKDIKKARIPINTVKRICEPKTNRQSYTFSEINPVKKHQVFKSYTYDGLHNFIGRRFKLLFGTGIIEYHRGREEFDFEFKYSTYNHLEREILERLESKFVDNLEHSTEYGMRVYPASIAGVRNAYQELIKVDKALRLAPRISRTIDDTVARLKI